MKRFLILFFILCVCFVSALSIRDFLNSVDYNGVNLISLGIASFNIQYTINTGVNFGIAGDASFSRQGLLSFIAIIICLSIIIWGLRTKQKWSLATAGLFAGGGLANAYERISFGGVFDYINFSNVVFYNPFSFNLADIYIFFGLLLQALVGYCACNPHTDTLLIKNIGLGSFFGTGILSLVFLIMYEIYTLITYWNVDSYFELSLILWQTIFGWNNSLLFALSLIVKYVFLCC